MPADTTTYRYSGDFKRCLQLKALAQQGVQVLGMLMSLGNLSTYQIKRVLEDGSVIKVYSSCGATYVDIFGVKKKKEEIKEPEEKKEEENLVLVYTGYKDNFSEYTAQDLAVRSKQLWDTIPQQSLIGLEKKRLLVLPCPKRELNNDEKELILKFASAKANRVLVFCGTDVAVANKVMEVLNTKLEFADIAEDEKTLRFASGYFPTKTSKFLFWLPVTTSALVVVKKAYWPDAMLKDWHGFGLSYDKINNLMPAYSYVQSKLPDWFITAVENYGYTVNLEKFEWKMDGWVISNIYKSGYITWNYDDKVEADLVAWCLANTSELPMPYLSWNNIEERGSASFKYGTHNTYTETLIHKNFYNGSWLAYADGENIIAAGFKPVWLSYAALGHIEDLSTEFPLVPFSCWALFSSLIPCADMFNTGSRFTLVNPYIYIVTISSGGWVPPIQQ